MSEQMIFCLGDGRLESKGEGYQKNYRIFNKSVAKERFHEVIGKKPNFTLPICTWTGQDKLETLSYKDAWTKGWKEASKEFKEWIFALPNFDLDIFNKITGLNLESINLQIPDLKGKEVEVKFEGQTYKAIIQ